MVHWGDPKKWQFFGKRKLKVLEFFGAVDP
jgi:hypothetical protein